MDEHDLTDPHGEAEALRRENARLRAEVRTYMDAAEANAVTAMRAIDRAEAADAITALRAQPDWKAMALRLGEAIKARKSARFASQLYEADEQIAAALSDLAKMKGE